MTAFPHARHDDAAGNRRQDVECADKLVVKRFGKGPNAFRFKRQNARCGFKVDALFGSLLLDLGGTQCFGPFLRDIDPVESLSTLATSNDPNHSRER
jgi:hypothetical protein